MERFAPDFGDIRKLMFTKFCDISSHNAICVRIYNIQEVYEILTQKVSKRDLSWDSIFKKLKIKCIFDPFKMHKIFSLARDH